MASNQNKIDDSVNAVKWLPTSYHNRSVVIASWRRAAIFEKLRENLLRFPMVLLDKVNAMG